MNRAVMLSLGAFVVLFATGAAGGAEVAGPRTTKVMGAEQSFDPYKNFRFHVLMDGRVVAGVSKLSGLDVESADVVRHRAGGEPGTVVKSPGRAKWEAITLERGITHDTSFESWANSAQTGADRREIAIEILDEAGNPVQRFTVHRAWVSQYQALPDLDAGANAVAIEHIKLENEGWDRDPPAK